MKFTLAIGNPPYGVGGNLAIKILNKTSEITDDIRFVLPTSMRKPSCQNKIKSYLHCEVDDDLDAATFPGGINAVKQYWKVKNTSRFEIGVNEIPMHTEHPDYEFLDYKPKSKGNTLKEITLIGNIDDKIDFPDWVGDEISEDTRYLNFSLAKKPYTQWH